MSETLDASNVYDDREDAIEEGAYSTGSGEKTVLHYSKKNFTKEDVIRSAFKGKNKLDRRWWKLVSTKDEYQLVMHPRLIEGSKLTSKKPLTYTEQQKFGVYETEQSAENRRQALSMESMFNQTPNPSFDMANVNGSFAFGNPIPASGSVPTRNRHQDVDAVNRFYGI